MYNPNDLHPLPRYGLAAALFDDTRGDPSKFPDLTNPEELVRLALSGLRNSYGNFLLAARPSADDQSRATYSEIAVSTKQSELPGSKSGRNSANGYYLAPHVLTGNNSAALVKELDKLEQALISGKADKNYPLKRSFAPLVSKINAGTKSMSDPPEDTLTAALTAVGVATARKAAALDFDNFTNVGLIPDLPFYDEATGSYPLNTYLQAIDELRRNLGGEVMVGSYDEKKKKYKRPPYYRGNYRYAPASVGLGAVSLLAAFGEWLEQLERDERAGLIDADDVRSVLSALARYPLYTIGYDRTDQELFGHHLVELATDRHLTEFTRRLTWVRFYDSPDRLDFSSPKWKLFRRYADHFLRFFTETSFRNFLSIRATYPAAFEPIFIKYFKHSTMTSTGIKTEIVDAAIAVGKYLNRAAYFSAKDKLETDSGRTSRSVYEYKTRVLASLESNLRSARTGEQLLAQISTLAGRITDRDMDAAAEPLMRAILLKEDDADHLPLGRAKDLIVAFMRLSTAQPKKDNATTDAADDDEPTED